MDAVRLAVAVAATFLARSNGYLVIDGGATVRVASTCACAEVRAGTPVALVFDDEHAVVEMRPARPGEKLETAIPAAALVGDPRSRASAQTAAAVRLVTVTLFVEIPPNTPPADDVYLSTERSGWSVAELRMDRVDALHFKVQVRVPDGTPLLYRYSRGSFSTLERDRAGLVPPPRRIEPRDGQIVHDAIARFADLS
jgi:hypothetical protein